MTTLLEGFAGLTAGTTLTTSNTQATSTTLNGGTWQVVTNASAPGTGVMGRVVGVSGSNAYVDYNIFNSTTAACSFTFATQSALPAADVTIAQFKTAAGSTPNVMNVIYKASNGRLFMTDNAGSLIWQSTSALSLSTVYDIRFAALSDAAAGTARLAYMAPTTDTAVEDSGTFTGQATKGGAITILRLWKASPAAVTFNYDIGNIRAADGTTTLRTKWAASPTAAFSSTVYGHTVVFDSTASTAVSPATIASYAWVFGDGGTSTSANPTYRYTTAGSYTATLTVTDSVGAVSSTTSHTASPVDGSGSVYYATITSAGAQTPTSGSGTSGVLAVISDTDPTSFTAATSPLALPIKGRLAPILPPASGDPIGITLFIDMVTASSGSVTAKLYETDGTTLRSTVSGTAIPDMTASGGTGTATSGTVVGTVEIFLPWSDVSAMSLAGWDRPVLALEETAS